jgi:hypothetical protein
VEKYKYAGLSYRPKYKMDTGKLRAERRNPEKNGGRT